MYFFLPRRVASPQLSTCCHYRRRGSRRAFLPQLRAQATSFLRRKASCGIYPTRWSGLNIYKLVNINYSNSSYNYIYTVYISLSLSPSPSPGVQHLAEGEPRTAWQFNARAQLLGVSYHQAKQQVTLKSLLLYKVLKRRQSKRESELRVH